MNLRKKKFTNFKKKILFMMSQWNMTLVELD